MILAQLLEDINIDNVFHLPLLTRRTANVSLIKVLKIGVIRNYFLMSTSEITCWSLNHPLLSCFPWRREVVNQCLPHSHRQELCSAAIKHKWKRLLSFIRIVLIFNLRISGVYDPWWFLRSFFWLYLFLASHFSKIKQGLSKKCIHLVSECLLFSSHCVKFRDCNWK